MPENNEKNHEKNEDSDALFTSHPDLIDPNWQRIAADADRKLRKVKPPKSPKPPKRPRQLRVRPFRPGPPPRRRTSGLALGVALLFLVVAGAYSLYNRPSTANPVAQIGGASGAVSGAASPTATSRQVAPVNLKQPFADTPAASWADGEAGIVPPVPASVGNHSSTAVANAYSQVKQELIAAYLDPKMLVAHDPSTFLALFPTDWSNQTKPKLITANPADDDGTVSLLENGFSLLPVPVKVSGSMSAGTNAHGDLTVHANYVFAYPFAPADANTITSPDQIIAVRHVSEDFTINGNDYAATSRGLWQTDLQSYDSQVACGPSKQGYLAPAYSDQSAGLYPDTENPDALYSPSHSMNIANTCGS